MDVTLELHYMYLSQYRIFFKRPNSFINTQHSVTVRLLYTIKRRRDDTNSQRYKSTLDTHLGAVNLVINWAPSSLPRRLFWDDQ